MRLKGSKGAGHLLSVGRVLHGSGRDVTAAAKQDVDVQVCVNSDEVH